MKIWIKSDATRFFVLLPTRLFLNSFLATIAIKIIKSKYPSIDISTQDFKKLICATMQYKRKHGRWEAVNISTADGTVVYISL